LHPEYLSPAEHLLLTGIILKSAAMNRTLHAGLLQISFTVLLLFFNRRNNNNRKFLPAKFEQEFYFTSS
jgi:hypothetical protein